MRPSAVSALALVSLSLVAGPLRAQDHAHAPEGEVGSVHFPTSCNALAQERFDRAVAMLHSFWFDAALDEFDRTAEADPGCAMAHWGTAMTLWGNPMARSAPSPERTAAALAAVRKAEALFASTTPRERAWVEAAAVLYRDHDRVGHLERMRRHEEAMAAVSGADPRDTEAAIFHGRIMVADADPADLTFAQQKAAAQRLLPLFEAQPLHPGLAHYIIHAFDAPPTAALGLEAARAYARIAPAAPHALHMPSHIFTRLGYWDESIETNRRSALAEPVPDGAVHPLDYMVYAYLQQGRDGAAGEVVGRVGDLDPDRFYGGILGYNSVALRVRYALERGDWETASRLPVPEGAPAYVEAVSRFGRAVGAARSGRPADARPETERMAALEASLREAGDAEWAARVAGQRLAAEGWLAHAEGDDASAVALSRQGADTEETVEKHPVTPGPLLPARELYGDLLLELGRYGEAQEAYEATLRREPRRARALYGAGRAAELGGRQGDARRFATELADLMSASDPGRREADWARSVARGR